MFRLVQNSFLKFLEWLRERELIDRKALSLKSFCNTTPYSAATEENGFPYGDYLLVSGFLDQASPELELAGEYLGMLVKTKSSK